MISITKTYLFKVQSKLSAREVFVYSLIICLAMYVLVPRFWEPGAESLKNWVSARIFSETGRFPTLHHGLLQTLVLQFFLLFDYPLSIQLEQLIKNLFANVALFILLRRFIPSVPALLLVCAWMPVMWTVEGGGSRAAAVGFFALYLWADDRSKWIKGYIPIFLISAALFDTAYMPFLMGHIIGTIIKKCLNNERIIRFKYSLSNVDFFPIIIKTSMVLIMVCGLLFHSTRPDGIAHGFNYPWVPFPQYSAVSIGCLQTANWYYVMKNFPPSEWIYQDWYFTHKEVFGGAQNILQAAIYNPGFFFRFLATQISPFIQVPSKFIAGFGKLQMPVFCKYLFCVFSWVLLFACFYKVFCYFKQNGLIQKLVSVILGTSAVIIVLILVHAVGSERRMVVLLPVAFLMIAHLGSSVQSIARLIYRFLYYNINCGVVVKSYSKKIWYYSNTQTWLTHVIILVIGLHVLLGVLSIHGKDSGPNNLYKNPFLLSGRMHEVHEELLKSVNKKTKVLALEEPWIRSFADVDQDNVYHALFLPPFEDSSGETERFLDSLDVIWVSYRFSKKQPSTATQVYLRYLLHVEPFLKKALLNGWTVQNVEGFGKIYKRPISD